MAGGRLSYVSRRALSRHSDYSRNAMVIDGVSCVAPMTILIGLMAALGIRESRGNRSI